MGQSWMFLIFTSDVAPPHVATNSMASRWPIAVVPCSHYAFSSQNVNLTLQTLAAEITKSFNKLSTDGTPVRDMRSFGGEEAPWLK